MIIESKAPTRVDLAGGTLDIWPLYLFHPGAVTINAAITRYASCVIETHEVGDEKIQLVSRGRQIQKLLQAPALEVPARWRWPSARPWTDLLRQGRAKWIGFISAAM